MNILAWLILGAIASDTVAGIAGPANERRSVLSVVLGTTAALVCGSIAGLLIGMKDPVQGALELAALTAAVIGAVITVFAQMALARRRSGRLLTDEEGQGRPR